MLQVEEMCEIIEEFSRKFTLGEIDREFFSDFVIYNDLGIPLAQSVLYKLANLTEEGRAVILETWNQLCELLDIDPMGEYADFEECLDEAEGPFDEE